jgi:hypothetical protein
MRRNLKKSTVRDMLAEHFEGMFGKQFSVAVDEALCKNQDAKILTVEAQPDGSRVCSIAITDDFVRAIFTPPAHSKYRRFMGSHDALLADPTSVTKLEQLVTQVNDL